VIKIEYIVLKEWKSPKRFCRASIIFIGNAGLYSMLTVQVQGDSFGGKIATAEAKALASCRKAVKTKLEEIKSEIEVHIFDVERQIEVAEWTK
jgi:hypothetical protein